MEKVKAWLGGKNFGAVLKAALLGVPVPLCSCSVIPTAVTLRKGGASNASTSAFLISTPESGVDSISITYALMDLPMTLLRPLAAFASAFFAGLLQLKLNDFELPREPAGGAEKTCCHSNKESTPSFGVKIQGIFQYGFGKLSNDIAGWLAVGLLLGALIQMMVPENFFENLSLMQNRLLILGIGIPFYICASASTPIAVSLMLKGLSPGSAILFLLVGPATNISNIAVLQKYIGKKGVMINIFSIAFVALIFSFLVDFLYAQFFVLQLNPMLSHQHESYAWWEQFFAFTLIILLVKGIFIEHIKPRLSKKQAACH